MEAPQRVKRISVVDKLISSLNPGERVKCKGSTSYWRNRQVAFHKENPDVRIEVKKINGIYYAVREV
ncbi:hypothetical protein [Pedobacter duraquae]|uniref:Uncharacterized protein n=1 Tax=Pedobacter duraquae TaxID=425511 RepID=A0A4R6IIY6_9SPHI|nr:hypothetical protein [Pedobacter duraquae]TDO21933.1 hypothetical protein CLV32_3041 [Pedobacter duraquae]